MDEASGAETPAPTAAPTEVEANAPVAEPDLAPPGARGRAAGSPTGAAAGCGARRTARRAAGPGRTARGPAGTGPCRTACRATGSGRTAGRIPVRAADSPRGSGSCPGTPAEAAPAPRPSRRPTRARLWKRCRLPRPRPPCRLPPRLPLPSKSRPIKPAEKTEEKPAEKPDAKKRRKDLTIRFRRTRTRLKTWADASGRYRIEARFVGVVEGGVVRLQRADGRFVRVAIDRLSASDQQWVRDAGHALAMK